MLRAGQSTLVALLALLLSLPIARAQELRMGVQAPFVVDPHWLFLGPNMAASRHIFDSLVGRDADARWAPSLAESWEQIDERTWEFRLRPRVRFHDGSPFTAADVAASIARIPSLQGNPGPFTPNIRTIVRTEIVDDYTIRLHTDRPNPTLPGQLTNVFIVSARLAKEPGEASGSRVAVGTGPYRLVSFRYGEGMTLERNEDYWGEKPYFPRVQIRVISNDAAREAALLAGDIDLMENVPPDDVARLNATPSVRVFARPADRVVFLLPNTGAETLPLLTDRAGQPLPSNPLRDLRVRQAMSLALDRRALVDRVLSGQGVPSMQLVPQGFVGWSPVPVPKPDAAAARRLLAEAGHPDGLRLAIACTNDRYVYDARMCQAIAQMLSRAGMQTAVDTMPGSMFMPKTRAGKNEMPLLLYAISLSSLRDVGYILPLVGHTPDESGNFGDGNRGSFSDPSLDRMIEDAIMLSGPSREPALRAAQAETVRLLGIIPLYHEYTIAAARAGISYRPRIDEQMVATGARLE